MRKMSRYFCSIPWSWRSSKGTENNTTAEGILNSMALACTSLTLVFTFREILKATNNFDPKLVLGQGGYGKVYKGTLEDGTVVAVKRRSPSSRQGMTEFDAEIRVLSSLRRRHPHIVSLIGYCDEGSEAILIYEYMANGSLRKRLHESNLPPLSWALRLQICIGAAKGLHYLHTGASHSTIHRGIKSSNIMLDNKFTAKVSDFGLSMNGPPLDKTHVNTCVMGTFGYIDPEYAGTGQLTEKSDVYAFGVVLLEVLCARAVIKPCLSREQSSLVEWALECHQKVEAEKIMDPALSGKVHPASLKWYWKAAEKCLAINGVDRPSMGEVLWDLEFALQHHHSSGDTSGCESPG